MKTFNFEYLREEIEKLGYNFDYIRNYSYKRYLLFKTHNNTIYDAHDFFQTALIGYKRAVETYDPKKRPDFNGWAYLWMTNNMSRLIENEIGRKKRIVSNSIENTQHITKIDEDEVFYWTKKDFAINNFIIKEVLESFLNKIEIIIFAETYNIFGESETFTDLAKKLNITFKKVKEILRETEKKIKKYWEDEILNV